MNVRCINKLILLFTKTFFMSITRRLLQRVSISINRLSITFKHFILDSPPARITRLKQHMQRPSTQLYANHISNLIPLDTMGAFSSKPKAKKPLGINPATISTLSDYLRSRAGAAVEYRYSTKNSHDGGILISQSQLNALAKKLEGLNILEFKYKFMAVNSEWMWPFPVDIEGSGNFQSAFKVY